MTPPRGSLTMGAAFKLSGRLGPVKVNVINTIQVVTTIVSVHRFFELGAIQIIRPLIYSGHASTKIITSQHKAVQ
jgi:hypothetical protein